MIPSSSFQELWKDEKRLEKMDPYPMDIMVELSTLFLPSEWGIRLRNFGLFLFSYRQIRSLITNVIFIFALQILFNNYA